VYRWQVQHGAARLRVFARRMLPLFSALLFWLHASSCALAAGNVQPASYAWGENTGWINFAPASGPGVTVTDSAVTGAAWSENLGWMLLAHAAGGVSNDGNGRLAGHAWFENAGWVDFAPAGGGVHIDAVGRFIGTAWSENTGWINFATTFPVTTTWRSSDWIFEDDFE